MSLFLNLDRDLDPMQRAPWIKITIKIKKKAKEVYQNNLDRSVEFTKALSSNSIVAEFYSLLD